MCPGVSAHTLLGWEASALRRSLRLGDAERALDSREALLDNGVAGGDARPEGSSGKEALLGLRSHADKTSLA